MTIEYNGGISAEAISIIEKTLNALATAHGTAQTTSGGTESRLFFPNGIELVYFKLNLGKDIDIQIALAGEKAKYPSDTGASSGVFTADDTGAHNLSAV